MKKKNIFFKVIKHFIITALASFGGFIISMLPVFLVFTLGFSIIFLGGDEIKEAAQEFASNFVNSLNQQMEVIKLNITSNLGDLSPQPLDVTTTDTCNCVKDDKYFNEEGNRIQDTYRIYNEAGDSDNKISRNDWIYTGWTIDDADYWDVDYSKFTSKSGQFENQLLFDYKVNDMSSITEQGTSKGRCTITFEHRYGYNEFPIELDESTRNGSFIRSKDGKTEWLDFGNYRFQTYDGRIMSAFAPMVTAGDAGFQAMTRARQYFHKGDVWHGESEADNGANRWFTNGKDNMWAGDIGFGSYIDVVFEDNVSHTQVVIPFIYCDAKNVHWFNSVGQRADERYGQFYGNVTPLKSNGSIDVEVPMYKATFRKYAETNEEYTSKSQREQKHHFGVMDITTFRSHMDTNSYFSSSGFKEGFVVDGLLDDPNIFEMFTFLGKDSNGEPCYLYLDDFEMYTEIKQEYYFSDDDIFNYKTFSPLELMRIDYKTDMLNTSPVQDFNNLISNTLLNSFIWEANPNNTRPDWSVVGMRVYKDAGVSSDAIEDVSLSNKFTETSKTFQKIDSINDCNANQIITYCSDNNCGCTICTKVAR